MGVIADKEANLHKAKRMIEEASEQGAQIVVLPEMFSTPYQNDYFPEYAEVCPGYTTDFLSEIASENGIYLIGGSIPEKEYEKIF